MNALTAVAVQCPYCWETIEVLVDCSQGEQQYIEDCSVCCRPITLVVTMTTAGPQVLAYPEDEA